MLSNLDNISDKLGFDDSQSDSVGLSLKMSPRVLKPLLKSESLEDKSVKSLFALWMRKKCQRAV